MALPQLSVAVAVPGLSVVEHEPSGLATVVSAGQEIDGASSSTTVTFWVQVAVFPAASVAVQVTVVSPSGKLDGALLVTVTELSQLSVAVAVPMSPT